MTNVLWLHTERFSSAQRNMVELYLRKAKFDPAQIFFVSLHSKVSNMWIRKKGTKNTWVCNPEKRAEVFKYLDAYIENSNAKFIVVNDAATLGYITGNKSLNLCRGSVYTYHDIPVLVIDDILLTHSQKHYAWVFLNDFGKLKRWVENEKRHEPKFTYTVCHNRDDIDAFSDNCIRCAVSSIDIETVANIISSISFTNLSANGELHTYVFPFYNPLKLNNCHWETADNEIAVWEVIKAFMASATIKVFQNGSYDCAYFILYNINVRNYFVDTLHLFHSIWCEAPKKLNFIASIILDHCRYWKDESKGEKDERMPTTVEGVERYWRYNGLDSHNTMLSAIRLVNYIVQEINLWALTNYNIELINQLGPALSMSMTGTLLHRGRQNAKTEKWRKEYTEHLADLRIMCNELEYNPFSDAQTASLIYDVLGAAPIKTRGKTKYGARTVDEKVLKLVRVQHPLFAKYIDQIWATKKPMNNISKYGTPGYNEKGKFVGLRAYNKRFLYSYNAAGTETGRYNGKGHQFWIGTNPQNENINIRDMNIADPGYILLDADYAQSDMWYIAHECADENMIENISDDRDTHCVHAEFFFKESYDKILQGHKNEEDWVDHNLRGIRQNTKRIVHGAHYRMEGFTLYMVMGHEAVVATAHALKFEDAHLWDRDKLVRLCDFILGNYKQLYPRLPTWFKESVAEAVNNGNRATCGFGRTRYFFGDMEKDAAIQRQLSAYFGQGGTAGCINAALCSIYYSSGLLADGLILLMQTHDNILSEFPEDQLTTMPKKVLTTMQRPCTIKGREFTVPVDMKIGLSWGKGMMKWHPGVTMNDIHENEQRHQEEVYGTH